MRLFKVLIILALSVGICHGATYTFHTDGYFTDPANWDNYPGTTMFSNDTLVIDANCENIDLFATDGYVLFTENCTTISISDLTVSDLCQLEFEAIFLMIYIYGYFQYSTNNMIIFPNSA